MPASKEIPTQTSGLPDFFLPDRALCSLLFGGNRGDSVADVIILSAEQINNGEYK
jgi:hypothetical protein